MRTGQANSISNFWKFLSMISSTTHEKCKINKAKKQTYCTKRDPEKTAEYDT